MGGQTLLSALTVHLLCALIAEWGRPEGGEQGPQTAGGQQQVACVCVFMCVCVGKLVSQDICWGWAHRLVSRQARQAKRRRRMGWSAGGAGGLPQIGCSGATRGVTGADERGASAA